MDQGKRFGHWRLLRFNGHFFRDAEVLPLTRADIAVLHQAAQADWRQVEPTIFGTLLTRALDPRERHRLGAEYTPREYVERVVLQTVGVPLRDRWAPVQAHAAELRATGKKKDAKAALKELRGFHTWMRGLRFLDPACGSGNFLYVCLHLVKRVELEVLREIEEITGNPDLQIEEVGPWQFHGIEVKPWAREIAELTLWIGYHQFWAEHHKGVNPPEPVLKDTGTLELRDAVLAWDEIVEDPARSRPDPTPRIVHPVTGRLVPDPEARLPYHEYRGARQAEWPQADFIVGNPPYMGRWRQREEFGDGYVDALRSAYPLLPDNADYVMFWWFRAAEEVAEGRTSRAGVITTNSITQAQQRPIIEYAENRGARVIWAAADHPWVEDSGTANVRVSITVLSRETGPATSVSVDAQGNVESERRVARLNVDLSAHADVAAAAAVPLLASKSLASQGFILVGDGFVLSSDEGHRLIDLEQKHADVLRPYFGGKELSGRSKDEYIIDFAFRTEAEARSYPVLYDIIRSRVKPARDANNDRSTREKWWRFGRNREEFRPALTSLRRYIGTVETAKHRFFAFLSGGTVTNHKIVLIALEDGFSLGVLSSAIHVIWALAAGAKLEDRPVYPKTTCFDPFPFPDPPNELREEIGRVAERLDQHRKEAIARDERVTMTGMYNVVEKLRSGEKLSDKERAVHEIAACGVLRDLHDELDRLVAQAYGWPWPMEREEVLERLVALHDERVEEEKRGVVRWLRPEYQGPRFGGTAPAAEPEMDLPEAPTPEAVGAEERQPWPAAAIEQIGAAKARVAAAPATPAEVASAFARAPVPLVARHLETLMMVGELRLIGGGRYAAVTEPL
jgi:hypothetical protein